jgi:hypothetical protein
MAQTFDRRTTRRRRIIRVGFAVLLIVTAVGTSLAVFSDQPSRGPQVAAGSEVRTPSFAAPADHGTPSPTPNLETSDPLTFARVVAETLFEWNTTAATQAEYAARLQTVADPTGEDSPGLTSDIANYLPTPAAWSMLREYRTRQWLEVTSAAVPDAWADAVAEASPGRLLLGTSAYTINGIRHRAGVWEGSPVSSEHDVAFTVFVVCQPSYPTCHLLRLSLPDKPLR